MNVLKFKVFASLAQILHLVLNASNKKKLNKKQYTYFRTSGKRHVSTRNNDQLLVFNLLNFRKIIYSAFGIGKAKQDSVQAAAQKFRRI